jgi:hypothetical protein
MGGSMGVCVSVSVSLEDIAGVSVSVMPSSVVGGTTDVSTVAAGTKNVDVEDTAVKTGVSVEAGSAP